MCARQHQVAEVACYRLREDTDGVHPISVLELTKNEVDESSMCHRTYMRCSSTSPPHTTVRFLKTACRKSNACSVIVTLPSTTPERGVTFNAPGVVSVLPSVNHRTAVPPPSSAADADVVVEFCVDNDGENDEDALST